MIAARKFVNVRIWGGSAPAYAEKCERQNGNIVVWVYDDVAAHWTMCHSLTPAQIRYVVARTLVVAS